MDKIKKAQKGVKIDSTSARKDSALVTTKKTTKDALAKISKDFANKKLEELSLKIYKNKSSLKTGGTVEKAKGGKWIQKAIKKPGALRAQLGAKPGEPIPAGKLAKAAKSKGKLGQRARLAQTLKRMKK